MRNINKFFLGAAAGIIACIVLSKTKSHLKPAAVDILSKAVNMKDDVSGFCSTVNKEALENCKERHINKDID